MTVRMAFLEAEDASFVVVLDWGERLSEHSSSHAVIRAARFSVHSYDDEDAFLRLLIKMHLMAADEGRLVRDVLLSMTRGVLPQLWTEVKLSDGQAKELTVGPQKLRDATESLSVFEFADDAQYFHAFLMQSPTPFVILSEREHRFSFINPPYVRMIGRVSPEEIVGRTVREVLPELTGQPFFHLLDEVYRTGVPFVGKQVPARLKNEKTGLLSDRYFDFIYHPLHDKLGSVCGIMIQAADVTDDVLVREVSEHREQMLYRQWAELETIYRTAPVGVGLIDVSDRRVLRLNERLAGFLGSSVEAVLERALDGLEGSPAGLTGLIDRAVAGESVQNFRLSRPDAATPGQGRSWLVSVGPALGATGEVEAVSCVTVEIHGASTPA